MTTEVRVVIDVPDKVQALEFYTQALGLKVLDAGGDHARLELGGLKIYLMTRAEGSSAAPSPAGTRTFARHWTPVHLDFHVDDVATTVQRVRDQGGTVEEEKSGGWGSAAFCADPFGNGFCVLHIAGEH